MAKNTGNVKVTLKGPLSTKKKANDGLKRGVKTALREVGKEMQEDVRSQLYRGHGYKTGHLRKRVMWHITDEWKKPELIMDTGAFKKNANVEYAYWIENGGRHPRWGSPTRFKGYHMFRNTMQKFTKNKRIEKAYDAGLKKELN
tara:strand:+ start:1210 stop:1641 length:432 start_codon:yes stop_codon:yes gene_type:complete